MQPPAPGPGGPGTRPPPGALTASFLAAKWPAPLRATTSSPDATRTCGRPTEAGEDTEEKDRWRLPLRKWLWELSPKSSQHRSQGLRREPQPVQSGGGTAHLRRARAPECAPSAPGPERAPSPGTGTGGGDPGVGGGGPARQPGEEPAPEGARSRASCGGVQPGRVSAGAGFAASCPHSPRCSALARPGGAGERTAATAVAAAAAAAGAAPPGGAGPGAGSPGRPRGREAGAGPPLAPEPGGAGPGRSHARLLLGTTPRARHARWGPGED